MSAKDWIKSAESQGWRVERIKARVIHLRCSKRGCDGEMSLPMANLGPAPEPCNKPHIGNYSAMTFQEYANLVEELKRRRRSLGLSQEDITAASGLADGHINKLEAIQRRAGMPILQLWAQTLGLSVSLTPAPLPKRTLQLIEGRIDKPYRADQARNKPTQKVLFNDDR